MLFDQEYKRQLSLLTERCVPPLEVLQKYKDDDNAFLSFTQDVFPRGAKDSNLNKSGTKIGINPLSNYDTPIGVYFYPIKAFWANLEKKSIPFAGNNPHLYIVKARNYDRLLVGSRYNDADYARDIEELQSIFPKFDFEDMESYIDSYYKRTPVQKFWSITRELASYIYNKKKEEGTPTTEKPVIWTQIMRRFYDGVVDDLGQGFIHSNEPTQAVIWTKAQFDVVDYVDRTCRGNLSNYTKVWGRNENANFPKFLIYYLSKGRLPKGVDEQKFMEKMDTIFANESEARRFLFDHDDELYNAIVNNESSKNLLINLILKLQSPRLTYSLITNVLRTPERVTDEMFEILSKSEEYTGEYLDYISYTNVPEILYNAVKEIPYYANRFASALLSKGEPIPDELLETVVKSGDYSYKLANKYLVRKMEIPPIILSGIAQDGYNSYIFARDCVDAGVEIPPIILSKVVEEGYYSSSLAREFIRHNNMKAFFEFTKLFKNLSEMPYAIKDDIADRDIRWAYKFLVDVLPRLGVDPRDAFIPKPENDNYSELSNIRTKFYKNPKWLRHVAKKIFNWKDLPKLFADYLDNIPTHATFLTEKNAFDRLYDKVLLESFQSHDIDMNRAYEIFNQEYLQSTGKSWAKDKFLQRAQNWEFWGDENGFVTTRSQNSGFIKLVGAAGSDKSKYKGFKELTQKNLPVWGMVDAKIAGLLKKMGFRGPNMIERIAFKNLLKSGKMDAVLGGAKLESIKGDEITLTYPDIGTVTKYFMGSPQYWKKMHMSILKK